MNGGRGYARHAGRVGRMAAVLGPLMVIGSAVRADTPFLWALRSWVRRQFANRSPTVIRAAPDYIDETGSITVTLSATDHNRDGLVYTATDGAKGRVTLNPDGHSFTYDPGAGATGADTFTVTATDATNFHLHGVIGLLTGRGHTARSTIAVQIPESSATADSGDPVTVGAGFGAVSGSVPVADADSLQPRYALVDQPARTTGVVVVDAQTGQWTFTPTPGARVRSFATRGVEEVATFSIAATNGAAACVPIVVSPRIRGTPIAAYPAVDGVPVGAIHMGPNGFGYQMVLRYDAGSEGYETAVAIIDPASTTPRITLPVAGVPLRLVFGPDGTAYQSTATVIPGTTTFDKYSMTVITPDGEATTIPLPGIPVGDLVVPGPTKTAYQITEIRPCDPREPIENETVVAAIDPVAGAATIVTRLPDLALEVVAAATDPDPTSDTVTDTASARTGTVVGSDGTTYELATGADGPAVVVTTPGGDPLRVELNGTLFPPVDLAGVPTFLSGVQFAPDGTPFVITGIHDGVYDPYLGSFGILEIAVLDPVSGAAKTTTVSGSEYGTLIFRADDTPVLYTHTARPGADGYDTAVTVVDLTAVKARSVTVAGYSTDYTVAADGTSFVVCMVDFDGTTGSVATYSLTAVNAETTASTTISLGGIPHGDMVLGPDGSVYQVVEMSDGDAVSTDVLIVRPGSLDITRIGLDGYPQSDVRFGPDGTGYVTTGTIDVHDATLRTVITVVAAAPTAHV